MNKRHSGWRAGSWALVMVLLGMTGLAFAQQSCPAGSIFSQRPTMVTGDGSVRVWVSDNAYGPGNTTAASAYDNYSLPAGAKITGLTWWGAEISGSTYCAAARLSPAFVITVYTNDTSGANPMPGTVVSSQTVTASKAATGDVYANTLNPGCPSLPLYQYTAVLPSSVAQTDGWISIRGAVAGSANGVIFLNISSVSASGTSTSILGNMREYNGVNLPYNVRTGANRDVAFCMAGTVLVPNVVGMTQAAATTALSTGMLVTGTVTQSYSATIPAGAVISQNPAAATEQPGGTAVALTVSLGPQPVPVPDVVGMTQSAAESAITGATLAVGTITQGYSPTVPVGSVISESPVAGTLAVPGTPVNLVISLGPHYVTVPDVTNLAQASAQAALTTALLTTGTISNQQSITVPAGAVISQNPLAGASVVEGTPVALVIALAPGTTPNVVGMTQTAAEAQLTSASLVLGTVTQQYSATVLAGLVISQNPVSGTSVLSGTAVNLVISQGPQPVPVPDVVGLPQNDAQSAITGATLTVGIVVQAYSPTVPTGSVVSQNPSAGTPALPGTEVDLVISQGPQPVNVPNVVGQAQSDAQTLITGATLAVGVVTQAYSSTVPSGSVISQNPAAGTSVLPGAAVDLVVSQGPRPVTVPNVVARTQSTAEGMIVGATLVVGVETQAYSPSVPYGSVISQNPAAGASVLPGTAVNLVVCTEPIVPNVVGESQNAAQTLIVASGLTVGVVTQTYSDTVSAGLVISQDPIEGTLSLPGTAVNLVVSKGAAPPVPVAGILGLSALVSAMGAMGIARQRRRR